MKKFNSGPASLDFHVVNESEIVHQDGSNRLKVSLYLNNFIKYNVIYSFYTLYSI